MTIKQRIWQTCSGNLQTIMMAAANIGISIPAKSDHDYERILAEIIRMRSNPITVELPDLKPIAQPEVQSHDAKKRYNDAHYLYACEQYPSVVRDGHYTLPIFPKVHTSNGLTTYIINYLTWLGCRATRINAMGRLVDKAEKQPSGVILTTKKYLPSTTRKGAADISSTIKGKSVMWEVKTGKDKPSEAQLLEQRRERRAGGEYFFVHSVNEFLTLLDTILYG